MAERTEIVIKDSCGNCKLFSRLPPEEVGKIAGVPATANGRCGRKKLFYAAFPEYRHDTNWCDQYVRAAK